MAVGKKLRIAGTRFQTFTCDLLREIAWRCSGAGRNGEGLDSFRNDHVWCFIVGCNNSGTSIMQRILEGHPDVSTMKVEGQMYTNIFPRAKKKGHERVWSEYLDELEVMPGRDDAVTRRLVSDWVGALRKPVGKVIVEKTPANLLRMEWLDAVFPQARFIGLVKNGYAVCEGINRKGNKEYDRAARHWNHVNKLLMENSGKVRYYMEIRYEDLCDNPEDTTARLAEFLGIGHGPFLEAVRSKFNFQTVDGHRPTGLVNFNAKSIARLSPEDIAAIDVNASEMLGYFGYKKG